MRSKVFSVVVVLLIFSHCSPVLASSTCQNNYIRAMYPHWGKSPVEGFKNVREYVISKQIVTGIKVVNGKVVAGTFYDPYSGSLYDFQRVKVHVDHFWALKYIHENGGACATPEQRRAIANDPINLVATLASANIKRSYKVGSFLPANGGYWGRYLAKMKAVPEKYTWLTVTGGTINRFKAVKDKAHQIRNGVFIDKQLNWFKRFLLSL